MADIDRLVDRYGRFEQRVRAWTEQWCRPHCSRCPRICCRTVFCAENRESAFLNRLVCRFSPRSVFSETHGWLGATGCTLVAGRPPVCYEFLCREIFADVSGDPLRQEALMTASMVITHVGKKAINGRHLAEAVREEDLNRTNPEKFLARLEEASAAFDLATDILDGRPSRASIDLLARILSPMRKYGKTIRRLM